RLEQVANSTEFQAVQRELEQLRKMILSLEEQIKKSGTEIEAANTQLGTLTAELDKVQGEHDQQAGVVSGQTTSFDSDIGSLTKERAKYTGLVDRPTLSQYDRVRVARGGLGIVP